LTRSEAVDEHWRERLAAGGLDQLGRLLDAAPDRAGLAGRWQPLTKPGLGGRQRWRWELGENGDRPPAVLYLKRYERTPIRSQLDRIRRQCARHSRAWWEFRIAGELAQASIPTPRAVGYVEEMHGRIEHRSAVLLEGAAGDALDRTWRRLSECGGPELRPPMRHDLAIRLGRFVAAFHSTGLCHRDLYLCHIFVELDAAGREPPRFCLIDLSRVHRPRLRRMRWILKDLGQLDASARQLGASRSDRLRTLLAYLGLQRGARRTRWYARRIVRRSDRILVRHERKSARS
jgi:heptose I phosphotransferase